MKSHGTYTIELVGRVLMIDAVGPFNEDAVKAYSKDLNTYIEKLAPDPWALCAVFRSESLFTPQAEEELKAVTRWRKEKGMKQVAVVFKDVKGLSILQDQMARIYEETNIPYAFFETKADAISWITPEAYIEQQLTQD